MKTDTNETLFKLTNELAELRMSLDNAEFDDNGEVVIDPLALDMQLDLENATAEKLDKYIDLRESLEHDAKMAKADYESKRDIIDKAKKRQKHAESVTRQIDAYLLSAMQTLNTDTLTGTTGRMLKVQKKPSRVEVAIDAKISLWDDSYYTVEFKPNKAAIKKDFKDRTDLPNGVKIIEQKKVVVK